VTPRADAVKDGRRPPPEAARSVLDGGEHGVTLALVGTAPGVVVGFTQAFHAGIASSRLLRVLIAVVGIGGGFVQPGPGRREAAEPAAAINRADIATAEAHHMITPTLSPQRAAKGGAREQRRCPQIIASIRLTRRGGLPTIRANMAGPSRPPPIPYERGVMIIDCHGHYTTEPQKLHDFRKNQVAAIKDPAQKPSPSAIKISDDELRSSVGGAQLKFQRERGTSLTIFSPRASGMSHHIGDEGVSLEWSQVSNDLIYRLTTLYPDNFIGVCQLPQSPGVNPKNCVGELARCIDQLGFVGCNLNPDPSGGYWNAPPLTDRWWYPLYEKLVELDVPAMIHVSASCNPNFHTTGAHYINGDTTAFMQLITSDLFKDFPTLKLIIPHGGGAVPYHWGRYRGIAQDLKRPPLEEHLLRNVYFDTCVYHLPGIELLTKVIPADNILFASEMVGAVKGIDPRTGHYYDDTKRYIDQVTWLTPEDKRKIFEGNARKVYSRLNKRVPAQGAA
jgi:4-oxalmesaconate hydratase